MPLPARTYDRTVNAELERILYQMSVVRQESEGLLNGLREDQFQWQPAPGRWSIAQCLEHLNVLNGLYIPIFEEGIRKGRAENMLSDGPYSYSWLSRYMFRTMQPPVKRRFKAPKRFEPGPGRPLESVLAEWNSTHERLEAIVREANGLDLQRIKIPSPVTSLIRYNLGMAFWIQTAHDRRHLWQAREVRNHASFPQ
jgi:hypothetical protein